MDLKSFNVLDEKTVKEFRKRLDDKAKESEWTIGLDSTLFPKREEIDGVNVTIFIKVEDNDYETCIWRNSLFVPENVFYSLAAFEFYTNYTKKV